MKAIKKGYRKGGKMYQEGGSPKATTKDLKRQINSLKKERDKMLSEQLIFGKTKYAKKYPKDKNLMMFGDGENSKVANRIRDFYAKEMDFLTKKIQGMEKEESEVKPYNRAEFLRMLGADSEE